MTLRAALVIFGLLTCMPCIGFLVLFQPPKDRFHGVTLSLRLLTSAVALGGLRVAVVSLANLNQPVVFAGWYDRTFALITLALAAAGSVAFLAAYLNERIWPKQ